MSLPYIPPCLYGKLCFWENQVSLKEDMILTEEEKRIFESFKIEFESPNDPDEISR